MLKGTGIISVALRCTLKTDHVIIDGFHTTESVITNEIVPYIDTNQFNIEKTMKNVRKSKEFKINNVITPNIINLGQKEKLEEISLSLKKSIWRTN